MDSYWILLFSQPGINWLLGLLFKSLLILSLTTGLLWLIRKHLSSTMAHLIWLGGLICTALLPVTDLINRLAPDSIIASNGTPVFTISAGSGVGMAQGETELGESLLWLYGIVAAALLIRLVKSALGLYLLHRKAAPLVDDAVNSQFGQLLENLGIKRPAQRCGRLGAVQFYRAKRRPD